MVARISPSMPCARTVAATSTMKAPGRPADLEAAAAERGDEKAADDRGVEPALRRGARGDGDRHRERQRDDRDGEPGDQVGPQAAAAVALAQDGDELRGEKLGKRGLAVLSAGMVGHGVFLCQAAGAAGRIDPKLGD